MIVLQGILVQSLNRVCVRGVAKLADLERLSTIDGNYQRNLIEEHREEMETFLKGTDLFFSEVLLSYHFKGLPSQDQITSLYEGNNVGSSKDAIRFKTKSVSTKVNGNLQTAIYVTIEIDEGKLGENKYPFFRIDGNHRLSAAASLDTEQAIRELNTPFCLLLLLGNTGEQEAASRSLERTIFYNVNSKSVPLTREEILRVVIDDSSGISNDELVDKFGDSHLYTRKSFKELNSNNYPSLKAILEGPPSEMRRILCELYEQLAHYNSIPVDIDVTQFTDKSFRKVERLYSEQRRLQASADIGLLLSFLFYAFRSEEKGGEFRFNYFSKWVIQNHFSEIGSINASSVIQLFEQIYTTKQREIFVSMPFAQKYKVHYTTFERVIKEINAETNDPKPLRLRKIDDYFSGVAYKIDEAILEQIQNAGLIIADLTSSNENVYHEVGYLMGLAARNELQTANVILVCNTSITDFPKIGFNLRSYKTLGFKDTGELVENLKKEIMTFYYPEENRLMKS